MLLTVSPYLLKRRRRSLRSAVWRVPLIGLPGVFGAALSTWVSNGRPGWSIVIRATADLLAWRRGPIRFELHTLAVHRRFHFAWIPLGVHLIELVTLLRSPT